MLCDVKMNSSVSLKRKKKLIFLLHTKMYGVYFLGECPEGLFSCFKASFKNTVATKESK